MDHCDTKAGLHARYSHDLATVIPESEEEPLTRGTTRLLESLLPQPEPKSEDPIRHPFRPTEDTSLKETLESPSSGDQSTLLGEAEPPKLKKEKPRFLSIRCSLAVCVLLAGLVGGYMLAQM